MVLMKTMTAVKMEAVMMMTPEVRQTGRQEDRQTGRQAGRHEVERYTERHIKTLPGRKIDR